MLVRPPPNPGLPKGGCLPHSAGYVGYPILVRELIAYHCKRARISHLRAADR